MTALAASLLLASTLAAADQPRVALLVGDDVGLPGEQPLRFTVSDARRLGTVLEELGGFQPANVHVLENRNATEILDQVEELATGAPAAVFVFYYSGHADAAALHPGGTILPLDLLLNRLRRVPAGLRLEILDACQSGAATRAKGSRPESPFDLRLEGETSSGDILVSSSAADEQSFESEHGGLFTLHWNAGLRGAADANGDGQVTLAEVYAYAYAQTLRSTLGAATGPQHATFRYEIEGHRDPVLTRLAGGGRLTLRSERAGVYVIFDASERSVVAELPARNDEPRRIALAPGEYVVRLRTTAALRVARIALARDDDRVLSEHQMQEVPFTRLARKGSLGDRFFSACAGAQGSKLGPAGQVLGGIGVEWDGDRWLSGIELGLSAGRETHGGLDTQDLLVQPSASLLYTLRLGTAALRVGPVAGAAYLRQAPTGHAARSSLGLSAGLRVRGDAQIARDLGLFLAADGRGLAVRLARDRGGSRLGVEPWAAVVAGLRAAF